MADEEETESILDADDVIGFLEYDDPGDETVLVFEAIRVAQKLGFYINVEWKQGVRPHPADESPLMRAERLQNSQVLIFTALEHR